MWIRTVSSLARSTLAASRRSPQQPALAATTDLREARRPARALGRLVVRQARVPATAEDDKKMTIDVTGGRVRAWGGARR